MVIVKAAGRVTYCQTRLGQLGRRVHAPEPSPFADGLALGVSFGKGHGLSTTLAVFFHEVPHNIADFAILIQNGFSQSSALKAQFVSAIGAFRWRPSAQPFPLCPACFHLDAASAPSPRRTPARPWPASLRTCCQTSIIQHCAASVTSNNLPVPPVGCLAGFLLRDMSGIQGFVAGGFIYIATVDIIPVMLQEAGFGLPLLFEVMAMARECRPPRRALRRHCIPHARA